MHRSARGWALVFILLSFGCDPSRIPGLWKVYEHPTYRFSVKVPRTWEIKSDGLGGSAVVFLAAEEDPIFHANVNFVVRSFDPKKELKSQIDLVAKQLSFLLNDYKVLSRAPTRLGNLPALELRARYKGPEGNRILRTILAVSQDRTYVATFSCRSPRETAFQKTFDRIRRGFHAQLNLSNP